MQQRVDVASGAPVVVRSADATSARKLEAIGARLHGAAHPGVVQVLTSAGTAEGGWELRTAHGGTPLSTIDGIDPRRLAAIGAGIATTLADLHDHGIVHGRLTAARVLISAHDRPTLCGFGSGHPQAGVDDDVAGLAGVLLERLDDRCDGRQVASVARRMRAVLDQALDPAPSRRPSMRRLASALAELGSTPAPVLRRPNVTRPRAARLDRPRLGTGRQLAVVGLAIVVLAIGAARWRSGPAARADADSAATATQEPSALSGSTPPEAPTAGRLDGAECARIEGDDVDAGADPASCPHDLAIDGTTVRIDGTGYEVGQASDVLAVGSWRCAGDATVVALRPATGEVFVFPAATTVEVTVRPLATVPGGTDFRTVSRSPRCQELQVVDRDGNATPLELRPS